METIYVSRQNVYGKTLVYPISEKAKLFAELVGKKTLSVQDLIIIKKFGHEIKYC